VTGRDGELLELWSKVNLDLNPESPTPLFVQVARAVRGFIVVLELPVGAPLPSEPTFAQQHGLSRETVRRAYHLLREVGALKSRRGVGTTVAAEIPVRRVTAAPGSYVFARALRPSDVSDIETESYSKLYGVMVLLLQAPGEPPIAYDPSRTTIVVPG